jgi:hypothetical protein
VLRCPRTHGGRDLGPGTVGAHRRLFHGQPRTGRAAARSPGGGANDGDGFQFVPRLSFRQPLRSPGPWAGASATTPDPEGRRAYHTNATWAMSALPSLAAVAAGPPGRLVRTSSRSTWRCSSTRSCSRSATDRSPTGPTVARRGSASRASKTSPGSGRDRAGEAAQCADRPAQPQGDHPCI